MAGKVLFPDETILQTKSFEVGQDWEVSIPGFFIVAPRRKVHSITEFGDDEATELITTLRTVRNAMRDVLDIKYVYLFENEDTAGNFHFWMFPRLKWMERFGSGIESVMPIMKYAVENMGDADNVNTVREVAKRIKEHLMRS